MSRSAGWRTSFPTPASAALLGGSRSPSSGSRRPRPCAPNSIRSPANVLSARHSRRLQATGRRLAGLQAALQPRQRPLRRDASVRVPVYAVRVLDGTIYVEPRPRSLPPAATTHRLRRARAGANGAIESVRGDRRIRANFGRLCTKGDELHKADPSFRALYPEVDNERVSWPRTGLPPRDSRKPSRGWPRRHRLYVSGQFLTRTTTSSTSWRRSHRHEQHHTNSRLCMAVLRRRLQQTLAGRCAAGCYETSTAAECLFIAAATPPGRIRCSSGAYEQAGPRHLVVVDRARRNGARGDAASADRARTDAPSSTACARDPREAGATSAMSPPHEGLEAVRAEVATCPGSGRARCRISERDLLDAARLFAHRARRSRFTAKAQQSASVARRRPPALINLHLAPGISEDRAPVPSA